MPLAVTLRLDSDAACRVESVWQELARRGVSRDAMALGYPPHITLVVLSDDASEAGLIGIAAATAHTRRPIQVSLTGFGLFPSSPAVLFLFPVPSVELLSCHACLLERLETAQVHPHFRGDAWTPHVTLASDIADPAAVVTVALTTVRLPITATAVALEIVRFRPVRTLATHPLSG